MYIYIYIHIHIYIYAYIYIYIHIYNIVVSDIMTNGVNTNGAAAKVFIFVRLGKQVRPGTFWKTHKLAKSQRFGSVVTEGSLRETSSRIVRSLLISQLLRAQIFVQTISSHKCLPRLRKFRQIQGRDRDAFAHQRCYHCAEGLLHSHAVMLRATV